MISLTLSRFCSSSNPCGLLLCDSFINGNLVLCNLALKMTSNDTYRFHFDLLSPSLSPYFQVKLRFKKFLRVLFKHMLDKHGGSGAEASAGAPAAGDAAAADDGLKGASVHTLVVSHGAYIRVAIKHLIEDLKCSLPAGAKASQLSSPCPNTGVSRFVLTLSQSESGPVLSAARCIFTNRKDHLEKLGPAE